MMIQVIPSYGREYRNIAEIKADLEAEKDFTVCNAFSKWDGMQCNRTDLRNEGFTKVKVRYGKGLTKVTVISIGV